VLFVHEIGAFPENRFILMAAYYSLLQSIAISFQACKDWRSIAEVESSTLRLTGGGKEAKALKSAQTAPRPKTLKAARH